MISSFFETKWTWFTVGAGSGEIVVALTPASGRASLEDDVDITLAEAYGSGRDKFGEGCGGSTGDGRGLFPLYCELDWV